MTERKEKEDTENEQQPARISLSFLRYRDGRPYYLRRVDEIPGLYIGEERYDLGEESTYPGLEKMEQRPLTLFERLLRYLVAGESEQGRKRQ